MHRLHITQRSTQEKSSVQKYMEAIQLSRSVCCWEACNTQEDKSHSASQTTIFGGFSLTSLCQDLTDVFIQHKRG